MSCAVPEGGGGDLELRIMSGELWIILRLAGRE